LVDGNFFCLWGKFLFYPHSADIQKKIMQMNLQECTPEKLTPQYFQINDDRLGRALDKYYQVGTTQLFTAIALKAAHKFQVEMKSVHLDGSSMSVEGEYKNKEKKCEKGERKGEELEPEMKAIEIVHGYSRDRRPDLKQFIIDTIVNRLHRLRGGGNRHQSDRCSTRDPSRKAAAGTEVSPNSQFDPHQGSNGCTQPRQDNGRLIGKLINFQSS
jgi:Domain of unknown function (DUF4277)